MKLERAQEHLTTAIAIVVGMSLAYYFGKLSGSGEFGRVAVVFIGLAFLALLLALREQIWILIPATWEFAGKVDAIKGSPAVKDLAVVMVFAGVFALRAFKVIRRKPTYRMLDFWVILMLAYLFTVFLRNPTGGDALGSERVGGRPYLNIFSAWLAYLVLARVALPARWAQRTFWALAGLLCLNNVLIALTIHFPATSPFLEPITGAASPDDPTQQMALANPDGDSRLMYLAGIGLSLLRALTSRFNPLTVVHPLNFVRFGAFVIGMICVLLSGFRSGLIQIGAIFLLAAYLWEGFSRVARLVGVGVLILLGLIFAQGSIIDLPFAAQRALSFLPGNWDSAAVRDAHDSSEWRYFMWRQMLFTDRYIASKWLGDGFGLTSAQLQQSTAAIAQNDVDQQRETFMIVGQVHSGPISTIRYVGYIGLAIFLCLAIALSVEAWKLCRATEKTPFYFLALFVCLPIIYFPFHFIVIFGSYDSDMVTCLMAAGMLKMLRTSLDSYKLEVEKTDQLSRPLFVENVEEQPVPAHLQY